MTSDNENEPHESVPPEISMKSKHLSTANLLKAAEEARVKRRKLAAVETDSRNVKNRGKLSDTNPAATPISATEEPEIVVLDSGNESENSNSTDHSNLKTEKSKAQTLDWRGSYLQVSVPSETESSEDSDSEPLKHEVNPGDGFHRIHYPQSISNGNRSQIRLLCDLSEPNAREKERSNLDTISMGNLIGAADLLETYQFNFSVSLPVILSFFHENFVRDYRKIVFITGNSVFSSPQIKDAIRKKYNVSEAVAPLPNKFASHHTKMMVNVFENGDVEVVVMTCNLTQIDLCGLTQAVWKSGRLSKGPTTTTQGKRFRFDLLRYIARYRLNVTKKVIATLEKVNFSSVDVELVASAPGIHDVNPESVHGEAYGYAKLRQVLERNNLLIENTGVKHNVLAQVTSIAYPFTSQKEKTSSVFSHILCPLMFKDWQRNLCPGPQSFENHQQEYNYIPRIIFPTKTNIARSTLGYMSGSAIHFKYENSAIHKAQYEQNVRPYICKWGKSGNVTGRETVTPHVKYYACDNGNNWKSLKWVMVGSHNLSKQAWGYPKPKTDGEKMDLASYELSVLIPSGGNALVPCYGKDTLSGSTNDQPVRFPFLLPPAQYEANDEPWSLESRCGSMSDRWGNVYP